MTEHTHDGAICKWCALDYEFEMPADIVEACRRGDLVLFAGAGVSTEVPAVFPSSFYNDMKTRSGSMAESFPGVMSDFEAKFSRTELVKELKARFDMADSFPSLRRAARQFHEAVSTIPYIQDIITTNWDTYFEEECLATPFVVGEDMAFAGIYPRRVFKIHGSIANVSTLVVTESDYAESLRRLSQNALGARVRDLLAGKVVVFVGYSMTDWNFQRLYAALRADMGKFAPAAYVVSPDDGRTAERSALTHLRTSGVKFIRELKYALEDDCLIPDERYDELGAIESRALRADEIAKDIPHQQYPSVLYCWMYLEGVTDACFRIQFRRGSGEYSDVHRVQILARRYLVAANQAEGRGRFHDAAYMQGYANVLLTFIIEEASDADAFPYFFVYGSDEDLTDPDKFRTAIDQSRRRAPRQRAHARRMLGDLPSDMILTHDRTLPDL